MENQENENPMGCMSFTVVVLGILMKNLPSSTESQGEAKKEDQFFRDFAGGTVKSVGSPD